MIQTVSGRGSVPARAYQVEVEGKSCVDWGEEGWADPAKGPLLLEFAGLSGLGQEEAGEAVARFVQRFGTLALCDEHRRGLNTWDHKDCEQLKPEPVDLWLKHVDTVANVLKAKADIEVGKEPFKIPAADPRRRGQGPTPEERWSVEAERMGRKKGLSHEQRAALHKLVLCLIVDGQEGSVSKRRELEVLRNQLETLREEHEPWTPEMARYWIGMKVNDGLSHFPVRLHLAADHQAPMGLRPALHPTSSVLSEVYFELAQEVASVGTVASCSGCGELYTPQRRPKRGQNNFCPGCQE
ncbi:hypothetical protein ACFL5A_03255, partial [Gemmatimonadota bacterium]